MRTRQDPFKPKPKGQPVKGTRRQLALLSAFTKYEVLPGRYLQALSGTPEYTQDLITLLNTEGYIRIPLPATRRLDARNRHALWEGTDKGEKLLGQKFRREGDHFGHKVHRTVARFSFDFAPKEIPGLVRRTLSDILADERCPPDTRYGEPHTFTVDGYKVIPDEALSGFQLNGRSFYFFFEADGGTETRIPTTPSAYKKKNIAKMISSYSFFFKSKGHRTRYGLSNIAVLIITKNETDKRSILKVIESLVPKELWRQFGLRVVPDFTEGFPPPTGHLVTEDWETVNGTLNIIKILGDSHGTSDTRQNSPAHRGEADD